MSKMHAGLTCFVLGGIARSSRVEVTADGCTCPFCKMHVDGADLHHEVRPIPLSTASLQRAWRWVCPTCRRENFLQAMHIEDPKVIAREKLRHGVPPDKPWLVLGYPEKVACNYCSHLARTEEERPELDLGADEDGGFDASVPFTEA